MEKLLHLLPQFLCLLLRCLLVDSAYVILRVHEKPLSLNNKYGFLLIVSPGRRFFFNSSPKSGMNHVSKRETMLTRNFSRFHLRVKVVPGGADPASNAHAHFPHVGFAGHLYSKTPNSSKHHLNAFCSSGFTGL
jgi:hypothetical protein